jgi:hypothetical protein
MRMRPIYKEAVCSAQGWHGHHPSRADCGQAQRPVRGSVLCFHRCPRRHKPGGEIAPQRHYQLARQGDDADALGALAGIGGTAAEPTAEFAFRLMPQPEPGQFDGLEAGARITRLADALLTIDAPALPGTGRIRNRRRPGGGCGSPCRTPRWSASWRTPGRAL